MSNEFNYEALLKDQLIIPSIILREYHTLGLNETEVVIILQIHRFQMQGNGFPTPFELAAVVSLSEQECSHVLRKLIQRNLLLIEQRQSEGNVLNEVYSLEPLWTKLYTKKDKPKKEKNVELKQTNIFILFEQEFGRPLSPFEIETINIWIDEEEQAPALIKAALREAVLMGKLNFRYIDRILREWKKKGIRSVEQARNQSKSFHVHQNNYDKTEQPKRDVSLYYNWLEEE